MRLIKAVLKSPVVFVDIDGSKHVLPKGSIIDIARIRAGSTFTDGKKAKKNTFKDKYIAIVEMKSIQIDASEFKTID